jgi:hypothetical protein
MRITRSIKSGALRSDPPDQRFITRKHRPRCIATSTSQNRVTHGAWIERGQRRRPASGRGIVTRLTLGVHTWVKTYLTADASITRGGTLKVRRSRRLDRAPKHIRGLGITRPDERKALINTGRLAGVIAQQLFPANFRLAT